MKNKRIAAKITLVLMGLFYLAILILALIDTPSAKNYLMAALFAAIVIPTVLYGYIIFIASRRRNGEDHLQDEDSGL